MAIVSEGVPRRVKATISTRSSSPWSAARRLTATRPKSPTVKSEKAMVVTESTDRSGARRKESERLTGEELHCASAARLIHRAVVDQAAVPHLDGAIRGLPHQIEIVGGHDHNGAAGVDVAEQLKDTAGGPLIEVAGRLVGQENGGIVDQRPSDGDPLLLAAGELPRIRPALGRESDLGQNPHDPGGDGIGPRTGHLQRKSDVLLGGPVLQQAEVLEHDAEPAPEPRHIRPA